MYFSLLFRDYHFVKKLKNNTRALKQTFLMLLTKFGKEWLLPLAATLWADSNGKKIFAKRKNAKSA